MKKEFVIILLSISFFTSVKAQDVDKSNFLGVWYAENSESSPRAMKISQEDGKIKVHIKNFAKGEAVLRANRLEMCVTNEVNYGKYWIGSWGGWYDEDHEWVPYESGHILVANSNGSHGTNGKVSGYYDKTEGRLAKANKEISKMSVHIKYSNEGTLELYWICHSDYYINDHALFYQGSASNMYNREPIIFTNW